MNVLSDHPQYKDLLKEQPPIAKPETKWLKAQGSFVNSACGRWQVRKSGDPVTYSLFNVRMVPFARLVRDGFASFAQVNEFLQRPDKTEASI